jgi:hypothetical protein
MFDFMKRLVGITPKPRRVSGARHPISILFGEEVEDAQHGPPRVLDSNMAALGGDVRRRRALPGGLREVTNAASHQGWQEHTPRRQSEHQQMRDFLRDGCVEPPQ